MEMYLSGQYRALVVKLYGDLDHHAAQEIRERVDREMGRTGSVNIAFDFSRVTFMDSSGIGVIMGRYKVCRALGGKVIIFGASEAVRRIIAMSGIENIVTVAGSLEQGMKEAAANV